MVSAWFYNENDPSDPRESHQFTPNRPVSLEELKKIGVLYWNFDVSSSQFYDRIQALMTERDYKNKDEIIISKEKLPNYDEKLKMFFTEHLHDDEEIRLIMEGAGYFDVRNAQDEWIRIHCTVGDLLVLPAGIYHRFILDTQNYIHAMRIFKEDPKWTPINRSESVAEQNSNRLNYLKSLDMQKTLQVL